MDLGKHSPRTSQPRAIASPAPDAGNGPLVRSHLGAPAALQAESGAEPCLQCGTHHAVSRRRVLHYLGLASAGVTGLIGGLVGYRPSSAAAEPEAGQVQCDSTPISINCGTNYRSCIGRCTDNDFSCCRHCEGKVGNCYKCCNADRYNRPIRVVVYNSKTTCYSCCRYCGK